MRKLNSYNSKDKVLIHQVSEEIILHKWKAAIFKRSINLVSKTSVGKLTYLNKMYNNKSVILRKKLQLAQHMELRQKRSKIFLYTMGNIMAKICNSNIKN